MVALPFACPILLLVSATMAEVKTVQDPGELGKALQLGSKFNQCKIAMCFCVMKDTYFAKCGRTAGGSLIYR